MAWSMGFVPLAVLPVAIRVDIANAKTGGDGALKQATGRKRISDSLSLSFVQYIDTQGLVSFRRTLCYTLCYPHRKCSSHLSPYNATGYILDAVPFE